MTRYAQDIISTLALLVLMLVGLGVDLFLRATPP